MRIESAGPAPARAAICLYAVAVLGTLYPGVVYLSRSEFMPYHARAAGLPWPAIAAGVQTLLLGLMRTTGIGAVTLGVALAMLLWIPCRRGEQWALRLLPALVLLYHGGLLAEMRWVAAATHAQPPWFLPLIPAAAAIAGAVLSFRR